MRVEQKVENVWRSNIAKISSFVRIAEARYFSRIYKKAEKVRHTSAFVIFYLSGKEREVAFVAGKKVGKAVARNRAKRLLRAHFIEVAPKLKSGAYIFVAKAPLLEMSYPARRKLFVEALRKIAVIKES